MSRETFHENISSVIKAMNNVCSVDGFSGENPCMNPIPFSYRLAPSNEDNYRLEILMTILN